MEKVPGLKLSCIECGVTVREKDEGLWDEVRRQIREISETTSVEDISGQPAIAASRKAYRNCGKDPARYRLSAEALLRRAVKRQLIYQINNVVDLLNLVSLSTGFSIGGYDAGKIDGSVEFGIGRRGEPYEGIGRGDLNIEFLPVFRDHSGAFGSPTSDSVRTAVDLKTRRFLMILIDFGSSSLLRDTTERATALLKNYAEAKDPETKIIASC